MTLSPETITIIQHAVTGTTAAGLVHWLHTNNGTIQKVWGFYKQERGLIGVIISCFIGNGWSKNSKVAAMAKAAVLDLEQINQDLARPLAYPEPAAPPAAPMLAAAPAAKTGLLVPK